MIAVSSLLSKTSSASSSSSIFISVREEVPDLERSVQQCLLHQEAGQQEQNPLCCQGEHHMSLSLSLSLFIFVFVFARTKPSMLLRRASYVSLSCIFIFSSQCMNHYLTTTMDWMYQILDCQYTLHYCYI